MKHFDCHWFHFKGASWFVQDMFSEITVYLHSPETNIEQRKEKPEWTSLHVYAESKGS